MFKEASKLKLRFVTARGPLSVEQLWDLEVISKDSNVLTLDKIASELKENYDESGKKSFFGEKSKKDKELKLKLDIVLEIGITKQEEAEALRDHSEFKKEEQRIQGLIVNKKQDAEKELSVEELEAKLKALRKK